MSSFGKQRGLSLISLIVLGIILGSIFVVGSQVVPSAVEYMNIKKAAKKAANAGGNAFDARRSFDLSAAADYITTISSKDIQIVQNNGKIIINFSYDKEIHLVGPAFLLIRYEGSESSSGY